MAYGKIDPKIEQAAHEAISNVLEKYRDKLAELNDLVTLTSHHSKALADISKMLAELHNRVTVLEEGVTPR